MYQEAIAAQELYDLREETGYCSGLDLHEWFNEQLGDPSPSGRTLVFADKAELFVVKSAAAIMRSGASPETDQAMREAMRVAATWRE